MAIGTTVYIAQVNKIDWSSRFPILQPNEPFEIFVSITADSNPDPDVTYPQSRRVDSPDIEIFLNNVFVRKANLGPLGTKWVALKAPPGEGVYSITARYLGNITYAPSNDNNGWTFGVTGLPFLSTDLMNTMGTFAIGSLVLLASKGMK